jgi:hypothetical protein
MPDRTQGVRGPFAGGGCLMFRFLAKRSARTRLDELERFLEFWYGPRRPSYGEAENRLRKLPLPYPLRRFYAFAGRWPAPHPLYRGDTFYEGHGGHHLRTPESVKRLPRGRLYFFIEYQGNWQGLTLAEGDDPPVWIKGVWGGGQRGTAQVAGSLSTFLVTHCLMATLYEFTNSPCCGWADPLVGNVHLVEWFRRSRPDAVRIWSADHRPCHNYVGSFFLFQGSILVHEVGKSYRFGAIHPEGVGLLERQLKGIGVEAGGGPKRSPPRTFAP